MTPESRMAAYKSAYEAANGTGGGADSDVRYRGGVYWVPSIFGGYPMAHNGAQIDAMIEILRRAAKARTK